MLDDVIRIGSAFNWITPAIAFLQDALNGPHRDFGISALSSWDRRRIRRLLTRHGVRVWGLMYSLDGEMLMFTVRASQARWAHYVLEREGVPIMYAPDEVSRPSKRRRPQDVPQVNIVARLFQFLDKLEKGQL